MNDLFYFIFICHCWDSKCYCVHDHRVNVAQLGLQEFRGKLVLDFLDQKYGMF